jgi:glycosyltransferase involved in cell wall biosynthesis
LRLGLVVPHIFMQRDILPGVIFSPGELALSLAVGLQRQGVEVTLYTPGPVDTPVRNVTGDLSGFEAELRVRGDDYLELLKKHPLVWVSLARQVQSELVARAFADANADELDVVHVYANEEDIALPFARFCERPVVFTHHDPFDLLVKYRRGYGRFRNLNWISVSMAQRRGMPADANWVANIYHGLDGEKWQPVQRPTGDYFAYLGRIVESKGVHLAIAAVREHNRLRAANGLSPIPLKIVGKHYAEASNDTFWQKRIEQELGGDIEYLGHYGEIESKSRFLGNARAVLVPSVFEEPFGMVLIEALASGVPVIGLDSGAIGEVVRDGETGFVVPKVMRSVTNAKGQLEAQIDEIRTITGLVTALGRVDEIDRRACRRDFEARFTLGRMVRDHLALYESLAARAAV